MIKSYIILKSFTNSYQFCIINSNTAVQRSGHKYMEQFQMQGLSREQVEQRIEQGLTNWTEKDVFKTKKEIVRAHTLTYFNFLNLFLAVLILLTGQFKNMTFMGVVIINSLIGIIQELKVKKIVDKLSVITASRTFVIRDGKRYQIPVEDVVQDDVMLVANGDQICADCVVLYSEGMEVNESMLTGESKPVRKQKGDPLLSGSFVVAGNGVGRVVHVGEDNYAAELTRKAKTKKRATSEMQNTIKRIIQVIGILIIPIGILLFLSQMQAEGATRNEAIVSTVAGIIGMIPEGLVLLTSVSFILGVGRLAKKRALVQEMEAIEALARVNVLCLDKTGTITTGELEVVEVLGVNDTSKERVETVMNELTFAFEDRNNTQDALIRHFHRTNVWTVDEKIPFSSERKYRAIRFIQEGCFVLGAPEFLAPGDEELMQKVAGYSREGYRVLLLGSCESIDIETGAVKGTVPVGLIVISDCIRPEAQDTFAYFRSQNVDIKVISGDNPVTVSQIAVKAGLEGGEKYVDASTLGNDPQLWKQAVCEYNVFGRVKPEQKQQLVHAYQAQKKVVGMVGDGVNDVLALKDADCGIAMAAGSDAAKQSAHIVLLDSDFACLKNIVSEGRMIITNIERVSALYLTKTIYSILLSVIFILLQRPYPFIPVQLSLVSAACIGFPSFILTLERTEDVNSTGFLRHVMRTALPAALTMVGVLLTVQLLLPFWEGNDALTYTYDLIIAGAVGILVVVRVCRPMNVLRGCLTVAVCAIFAAGVILMPDFLGIYQVFSWQIALAVPLVCMVILLYRGLTRLVLAGYALRDRLKQKMRDLFPHREEKQKL